MQELLPRVQNFLLYLLLIIIGLYAGMLFFHELCPVETHLKPLEFVRYWKIVDGVFMHPRMGLIGPIMMGLFILNLAFNLSKWKNRGFLILALSFILFVVDIAFTMNMQMPVNETINQLSLENISEHDLVLAASLQKTTISNFHVRFFLGMASFATLCLAPFVSKKIPA
jgi:hypothetical protein